MAGPDPRVPISLPEPGAAFAPPLDADLGAPLRRVGARRPAARCRSTPRSPRSSTRARRVFEAIGCRTEEAFPDLADAREVFFTLRAHGFAADLGELLDEHRDQMKATVMWNIEEGLRLTGDDIARA